MTKPKESLQDKATAAAKGDEKEALTQEQKAAAATEKRREAIVEEFDAGDVCEHHLVGEVLNLMCEVPDKPKHEQRVYAMRTGTYRMITLKPAGTKLNEKHESVTIPGVISVSQEDPRLSRKRRGNEDPIRVLRVAQQDSVTRPAHPITAKEFCAMIEGHRHFTRENNPLIVPWDEYCDDRMDEVLVLARGDKMRADRATRKASKRGLRS
jgi:hypothetical protein